MNSLSDNFSQWDVADSDDFFGVYEKSIPDPSNKSKQFSLKTVMDPWINQRGYPVIDVLRDYENDKAFITQNLFVSDDSSANPSKHVYRWFVPLSYATKNLPNFNDTLPKLWLTPEDENLEILIPRNEWVIFNIQQTGKSAAIIFNVNFSLRFTRRFNAAGFYRVNYDERNWRMLINYLNTSDSNFQNIHRVNRAQLIDDALAFAQEEIINLDVLLNLTDYLANEDDYVAWYPAYRAFDWLRSKLRNSKYWEAFKVKINKRKKEKYHLV